MFAYLVGNSVTWYDFFLFFIFFENGHGMIFGSSGKMISSR